MRLRRVVVLLVALVGACGTPPEAAPPECADEIAQVSITTEEEVAAMRAEGPEALARLLTEYDAAT
ncbi:MAG TPA: hypothetical protein VG755_37975, partial [Nannocystaceae bacterium]|nr:hypothetical protein [Nannocystaceae bacterium]